MSRIGPMTCSSHWPCQSSSVSSSSGRDEARARVVDEHVDAAEALGAGRDDPLAGAGAVTSRRALAARRRDRATSSPSRATSSTRALAAQQPRGRERRCRASRR